MAQEGVLGRTSCRSWVSWACWGGMRAHIGFSEPELKKGNTTAHWKLFQRGFLHGLAPTYRVRHSTVVQRVKPTT